MDETFYASLAATIERGKVKLGNGLEVSQRELE